MNFLKEIDNTWTLFLDRDGVINHEKKGDYIRNVAEFEFYDGALEAMRLFSQKFKYIIIVTNQRGIGRGLMTHEDLAAIHAYVKAEVVKAGGKIDAFYYAPEVATDAVNRKPNTGMALHAKKDFPGLVFDKSIMVGNNLSDMQFGKSAGMKTVFLHTTNPDQHEHEAVDLFYPGILDFAKNIF